MPHIQRLVAVCRRCSASSQMNHQILDVTNSSEKYRQQDIYEVVNRLFWSILLFLTVIFLVLLMLIICFGVNQKPKGDPIMTSNSVAKITTSITAGPPHVNRIRRQDVLTPNRSGHRNLLIATEYRAFVRAQLGHMFQHHSESLRFAGFIKKRVQKDKLTSEERLTNETPIIRLSLDWIPLHYTLDFDVRLQSIYQNNTEPDTLFTSQTRILIRCAHPTNELRIHTKQLRILQLTLKRISSPSNLIRDWTLIGSAEMLVCQLREYCVKNEEYVFESEYTAELDREMNGFFLSQYNVTNSTTGEIVTHNIGATYMHVSRKVRKNN
jgi:hypothetical protein